MALAFEEPLTLKEAAEFLGLKPSGIHMNVHRFKSPEDKRRIPHYKSPNNRLYFYRTELNMWITQKTYKKAA